MAQLKYHQPVLDLLGLHIDLPPRRLAMIEEREAVCRVRFPASVREWFSVESAETLFYENTNEDQGPDQCRNAAQNGQQAATLLAQDIAKRQR